VPLKNETALKDAVVRWLKARKAEGMPIWWAKIASGPFQAPGLPDFLLCIDGMFVGLELKHPDGTGALTPRQAATLLAIESAHGTTFVAITVDEVAAYVFEVLRAARGRPRPVEPTIASEGGARAPRRGRPA
jgi:hypothetical protein